MRVCNHIYELKDLHLENLKLSEFHDARPREVIRGGTGEKVQAKN